MIAHTPNTLPSARTFQRVLESMEADAPIDQREKVLRQHIHAMNVLLIDQHLHRLVGQRQHLEKPMTVAFHLANDHQPSDSGIQCFADHVKLTFHPLRDAAFYPAMPLVRFVKMGFDARQQAFELAESLIAYARTHYEARKAAPDPITLEPAR